MNVPRKPAPWALVGVARNQLSTQTVAVCFDRFGPYHHARLRAAGLRFRILAIELSNVDRTYAWDKVEQAGDVKKVTVFADANFDKIRRGKVSQGIVGALAAADPDVVTIPGWFSPEWLVALRWCISESRPAVLLSDSTQHDLPRYAWTEAIKRRVVRLYSGALVAGTPQRAYARVLGLSDDVIFDGFDVVDNAHFARGAKAARHDEIRLRAELGLPEHFFLAVGRFVGNGPDAGVKNHFRLLDAYARYRQRAAANAWKLVLVGDGEQYEEIQRHRSSLGLEGDVYIPGFKQYNELPSYYGLASAFVHPSLKDTWGLVVNEAMAAGLPVLVSNCCGCASDLVKNGVNGYTFDPCNVEELAGLMLRVASNERDCRSMGQGSQDIIKEWGPERFADGLMRAVDVALSRPVPRPSWFDRVLLWALIRR